MKNILVTRQAEQAGELVNLLSSKGLLPFILPLIETIPAPTISTDKNDYDYVIFTSPNAVRYFAPYMVKIACGKIVAVGSATANALERYTGSSPDLVPESFSSEGLNKLFSKTDLEGKNFLIPGAKTRAGNTADYLRAKGAVAELPTTYTTEYVTYEDGEVEKFLSDFKIDCITLCSPSAAKSLNNQIELSKLNVHMIAIGKTTYDAVVALGGHCLYPEKYTLHDMIELI